MNDSFVHRGARRAEIGKLRLYAFALQHVGRRHRLAALLVGDSALDNCPMDAARGGLIRLVGHILKTPIHHRFERVELLLGLFRRRVPTSSRLSTSRVPAVRTAAPWGTPSTVRFPPAHHARFPVTCASL